MPFTEYFNESEKLNGCMDTLSRGEVKNHTKSLEAEGHSY
jgi:hypothetical protein